MRSRKTIAMAALMLTLTTREAFGEIYHLKSPSTLRTEKGSELTLPPGYFLDEQTWQERDLELRRLQELETRLVAENKSLREDAAFPPWMAVTFGAVGVALGVTVMLVK